MNRITADVFNCGHNRTPANTIKSGKGYRQGRCRYCKSGVVSPGIFAESLRLERAAEGRAAHRLSDYVSPVVPIAPQPDTVSEAVARYRHEKALAAARRPDRLTSAKAQYLALLEREREAGKGGRPGKPRIVAVRVPDIDRLVDALGVYGGEGR